MRVRRSLKSPSLLASPTKLISRDNSRRRSGSRQGSGGHVQPKLANGTNGTPARKRQAQACLKMAQSTNDIAENFLAKLAWSVVAVARSDRRQGRWLVSL